MNREQLKSAARVAKALTQNKLLAYEPYEKQREFHDNGAHFRERAIMAANQSGKTLSAAMEVAMHCTGRYPADWKGKRFTHPVRGWVAGTSAEGTRDSVQRLLLGGETPDRYGTGAIPKSSLKEVKTAKGVTGGAGQIFVHHKSGGTSYIGVRTYEQDIDRWSSESLDFIWFDEEPPAKHYSEGLTRLNARNGIALMTLTPLLGNTNVVQMFYPHPSTNDRALTMMTLDDVGHYTEAEKQQIIASYPEFEREARTLGIPMLGSGRVFPVTISSISVDAFEIPEHWSILSGIDFGWDHPTGCVSTAWDRDADIIYVTHAYKERERTPDQMSVELRHWNSNQSMWCWPHDGHIIGDRDRNITVSNQYKRQGLRMLPDHATFDDGGHSTEAGILDMLQRMQSGRFKVFRHLSEWFGEFNVYHRKDGKIVKEMDDLISATRCCVMAKRYGRTRARPTNFPTTIGTDYDPLSQARA